MDRSFGSTKPNANNSAGTEAARRDVTKPWPEALARRLGTLGLSLLATSDLRDQAKCLIVGCTNVTANFALTSVRFSDYSASAASSE